MKKDNRIQKIMRAVLLPCLFTLACMACTQDEELVNSGGGNLPADKETRVNFSIVVPSPVQTRATKSAPDEGAVNRIYLLLFEGGTYKYKIPAENISVVSPTEKKFHVNLPTGKYDIVVLANATEIIAGAASSFGDPKDKVLEALVETNSGQWNSSDIPMWGRVDNQTIDGQTDFTGSNAIPMIRMLAKIEIKVGAKAAGTNNENFKLTDIRLYNYSSRGALVPDAAKWPDNNQATDPTQPAGGYGTMQYPANEPLVFNDICYTYEAPAGGGKAAQMASNTCLVIGGSYRNGATTYYRVDFVDNSASQNTYLPLLRNHHYLVTVVDVVGDGYPTPGMAFETARSNMQTTVAGWNESGLGEVVVDGQNSLEVSRSLVTFPNYAQTISTANNSLTIRTSVTGGWKVEKITEEITGQGEQPATWLSPSLDEYAGNDPQDIFIRADVNPAGTGRTAYIYIRAGQLSFRVTVVQKEVYNIWLTDEHGNEITELNFPLKGNNEGEALQVQWIPASAAVSVYKTDIGKDSNGPKGFTAHQGPDAGDITNPNGLEVYDIYADPYTGNDPFAHLATKIDFTITNGAEIVTRSVFLRQFDLTVVPVVPSTPFSLDGGEKSIGIRSNTTWRITKVEDTYNIITNRSTLTGRTGGLNTSAAGETLSFRIATQAGSTSPEAYIHIQDAQGKTYKVTIRAVSSASSVYQINNNLLMWKEDFDTSSRTWYDLADVPDGTDNAAIPPAVPRNTTVNSLSCAAIDTNNPNLWRLPTKSEMKDIFEYVKNNGGHAAYGIKDVYTTGEDLGITALTKGGYWTAESVNGTYALAYFVGYNTDKKQLTTGGATKASKGSYSANSAPRPLYARCVRSITQ